MLWRSRLTAVSGSGTAVPRPGVPRDVPVSLTAASDTGVESDPDCSGADDRRDPELPIATGRGGAGVSWQRASLTKPAD